MKTADPVEPPRWILELRLAVEGADWRDIVERMPTSRWLQGDTDDEILTAPRSTTKVDGLDCLVDREILARATLLGADLAASDREMAALAAAYLAAADLSAIREDIYEVLSRSPAEVPGLLSIVREGRISGSTYDGEHTCLVGTLAKLRGCRPDHIGGDPRRPAERFFALIVTGDTPATNRASALVERWIVDWLASPAAATKHTGSCC